VVYPTHFGDGSGANRPWLQETPNPNTTVTWNSWIEINPETAEGWVFTMTILSWCALRLAKLRQWHICTRPSALRPLWIPFGQGHTALGRFAEGRGANPARLLEVSVNEAGDLAYADTTVTLEVTGRRRPLARAESETGVYGKH
jgi:hypothetical protein